LVKKTHRPIKKNTFRGEPQKVETCLRNISPLAGRGRSPPRASSAYCAIKKASAWGKLGVSGGMEIVQTDKIFKAPYSCTRPDGKALSGLKGNLKGKKQERNRHAKRLRNSLRVGLEARS